MPKSPMRPDLLHAQASVDWTVSQLPSFRDRINAWLRKNIYVAFDDPDPSVPNDVVVVVERELFPLSFMVEAGAYLNALRSSLDILACILAARHGLPKPDEVYFPIAASAEVFKSPKSSAARFLNGLPENERAKIEALQPYGGGYSDGGAGNELLWSLHRLDIIRKHKRLLEPAIRPQTIVVSGWAPDLDDAFTPVVHGHVSVYDRTVIGLLTKGYRDKVQIACTPFIVFNEPMLVRYKPAIELLEEYAKLASAIIALFDSP
jgi:hypothetical protein